MGQSFGHVHMQSYAPFEEVVLSASSPEEKTTSQIDQRAFFLQHKSPHDVCFCLCVCVYVSVFVEVRLYTVHHLNCTT